MKVKLSLFSILICVIFFTCCKSKLAHKFLFRKGNSANVNLSGNQVLIKQFLNFLDNYSIEDSDGDIDLDADANDYITVNGGSDTFEIFKINDPAISIQEDTYNPSSPVSFRKHFINNYRGSMVNLKLIKSGFQMDSNLYLPLNYSILYPDTNTFILHKSTGFNINWTTDPNPLNNKGVLIELNYSLNNHRVLDSTLQGTDVRRRFLVDDKGSFFITPQILNDFPECRWLQITVVKGNYINFKVYNKNLPILYKDVKLLSFELKN